jgi:hypothetical protein
MDGDYLIGFTLQTFIDLGDVVYRWSFDMGLGRTFLHQPGHPFEIRGWTVVNLELTTVDGHRRNRDDLVAEQR